MARSRNSFCSSRRGTISKNVHPCQACGRTLDSNRYMSSGVKARIAEYLPEGVEFKISAIRCSLPPANMHPKLRTRNSFICQSCKKYLNKTLKNLGSLPEPGRTSKRLTDSADIEVEPPSSVSEPPRAEQLTRMSNTISIAPTFCIDRNRVLAERSALHR